MLSGTLKSAHSLADKAWLRKQDLGTYRLRAKKHNLSRWVLYPAKAELGHAYRLSLIASGAMPVNGRAAYTPTKAIPDDGNNRVQYGYKYTNLYIGQTRVKSAHSEVL